MMPSVGSRTNLIFVPLSLLLFAACAQAQEAAQKTNFYDVQMTKDDIYKYSGLKFVGDYTTFESPSGMLVLGKTEAGVTIAIVLGGGTVSIEAPEAVRDKFKTVFNDYPLKAKFTTLYMRLNPKEYDETIGKLQLNKAPDDDALAKAKELYDLKFLASYHAGPRAIFPPYKTRVMEFDMPDIGQVSNEEGYWITLRRLSPYGSVYPSRFINPKQK